jgi:hypothetical protein
MRRRIDYDERLLREYVQSILLEDEAGGNTALFTPGGGYNAYDAGFSMGGAQFGGGKEMYDAFIGPFVDVFKTGVGKTKEIARKTRTLLWVSLQTILTTLIPFYGYNYADVFDKEKEDIEKIRGEYKDVYDRTEEALKGPDAMLLAFMASPAITLGAFAAKATPDVVKGLFSTVSGGLSDDLYDGLKDKLEKLGRWSLGDDGRSSSSSKRSSKSRRDPSSFFGESLVLEKDEEKRKGKIYGPKELLKSKKLLKTVVSSPKAQKMADDAKKVYRKTLGDAYAEAEKTLKKTQTIEDVEKAALASKAKGSAEIKQKVAEIKKLPPEEKKKAEEMLIKGIRTPMKELYVKGLEDRVKAVVDAGIPEESDFVKDHRQVIQKIKSL